MAFTGKRGGIPTTGVVAGIQGAHAIVGVSRPLWTWPRTVMAKPHSSWCFCSLEVETAESST